MNEQENPRDCTENALQDEQSSSAEQSSPASKNAAAIKRYLSSAEDPRQQRKAQKAMKKSRANGDGSRKGGRTLAGRQSVVIAVIAAVVVALIPLYFAVIRPLVNSSPTTPSKGNEAIVPQDGEVQNSNGLVGMMPSLGYDDVEELIISNDSGEWGFYYYKPHNAYYIIDHKNTIIDNSTWTTILYQFGTAVFTSRAATGENIDYSLYGLAPEDSPAVCTIKTRDGDIHKIYVGAPTATGSGYYAYYEHAGERRNTVYIVSGYMGMCAGLSQYDMMNPIVTAPLNQEDYVPEVFDIYHNGYSFVKIRQLSESEIIQTETAKTSHVFTPDGIEYNTSSTYMTMLYNVLQKGISGTRVVMAGKDDQALTADDLAQFGIRVPAASTGKTSEDASSDVEASGESAFDPTTQPSMRLIFSKDGISQDILFSEKTEDGTYFVYVMYYDIIVEVNASAVSFMEWDLKNFIEASIYLMSVYDVKDITVDSMTMGDQYVSSGVPRVHETFRLSSKLTTNADGSTANVLTNVTVDSLNGATVPNPVDSKDDGITNFKQYYMVLMTIGVQLDVPTDVLKKIDLESPDLTVTVHTVRDQEHILRFYFYNSRHAYYTLDGEGQFYVVYDELTKFLADTVSLIEGRTVDWETNNNNNVQVDENTGETTVTNPPKAEENPEEEKLPSYIRVILLIVAVVIVFGVGGFILYAVVQKKKQTREDLSDSGEN